MTKGNSDVFKKYCKSSLFVLTLITGISISTVSYAPVDLYKTLEDAARAADQALQGPDVGVSPFEHLFNTVAEFVGTQLVRQDPEGAFQLEESILGPLEERELFKSFNANLFRRLDLEDTFPRDVIPAMKRSIPIYLKNKLLHDLKKGPENGGMDAADLVAFRKGFEKNVALGNKIQLEVDRLELAIKEKQARSESTKREEELLVQKKQEAGEAFGHAMMEVIVRCGPHVQKLFQMLKAKDEGGWVSLGIKKVRSKLPPMEQGAVYDHMAKGLMGQNWTFPIGSTLPDGRKVVQEGGEVRTLSTPEEALFVIKQYIQLGKSAGTGTVGQAYFAQYRDDVAIPFSEARKIIIKVPKPDIIAKLEEDGSLLDEAFHTIVEQDKGLDQSHPDKVAKIKGDSLSRINRNIIEAEIEEVKPEHEIANLKNVALTYRDPHDDTLGTISNVSGKIFDLLEKHVVPMTVAPGVKMSDFEKQLRDDKAALDKEAKNLAGNTTPEALESLQKIELKQKVIHEKFKQLAIAVGKFATKNTLFILANNRVHADPHDGNFHVLWNEETQKLTLIPLDWGAVVTPTGGHEKSEERIAAEHLELKRYLMAINLAAITGRAEPFLNFFKDHRNVMSVGPEDQKRILTVLQEVLDKHIKLSETLRSPQNLLGSKHRIRVDSVIKDLGKALADYEINHRQGGTMPVGAFRLLRPNILLGDKLDQLRQDLGHGGVSELPYFSRTLTGISMRALLGREFTNMIPGLGKKTYWSDGQFLDTVKHGFGNINYTTKFLHSILGIKNPLVAPAFGSEAWNGMLSENDSLNRGAKNCGPGGCFTTMYDSSGETFPEFESLEALSIDRPLSDSSSRSLVPRQKSGQGPFGPGGPKRFYSTYPERPSSASSSTPPNFFGEERIVQILGKSFVFKKGGGIKLVETGDLDSTSDLIIPSRNSGLGSGPFSKLLARYRPGSFYANGVCGYLPRKAFTEVDQVVHDVTEPLEADQLGPKEPEVLNLVFNALNQGKALEVSGTEIEDDVERVVEQIPCNPEKEVNQAEVYNQVVHTLAPFSYTSLLTMNQQLMLLSQTMNSKKQKELLRIQQQQDELLQRQEVERQFKREQERIRQMLEMQRRAEEMRRLQEQRALQLRKAEELRVARELQMNRPFVYKPKFQLNPPPVCVRGIQKALGFLKFIK